ncbi:MAG: LacI family DNA-binding transcriptional regulator [Hyphomicrobiaceae bacterium]
MSTKPKPSINDVASRAGVSTATVSRALNEPRKVKPATLESVRNAVELLGYTPHFGGRALASNKSNTIGALIPTMENAIFARGLQALQETLAEAGVTLLIATTGYDPERERQQIQTLLGRGVDGVLLIGLSRPEKTYALLDRHDVPVVIAWSYKTNSDHLCVGFDNRAAASAMANCVLDHGHERIAMIAGVSKGNDRAAERIKGVRLALRRQGRKLPPDHLIESPYTLEDAAAAMAELLALPQRPTAVICGNDVLAAGAIMQAKRTGLAVPHDLSVVGFDNIDLASVTAPPLTTIHVPHRRMGQTAAELLLAIGEGADDLSSVKFDPEIVIRESLSKPPRNE